MRAATIGEMKQVKEASAAPQQQNQRQVDLDERTTGREPAPLASHQTIPITTGMFSHSIPLVGSWTQLGPVAMIGRHSCSNRQTAFSTIIVDAILKAQAIKLRSLGLCPLNFTTLTQRPQLFE